MDVSRPASCGKHHPVLSLPEEITPDLNLSASGLTLAVPGIHCYSHFHHLWPHRSLYSVGFASTGIPGINRLGVGSQMGEEAGACGHSQDAAPTLGGGGSPAPLAFFKIRMLYPGPGSFQVCPYCISRKLKT